MRCRSLPKTVSPWWRCYEKPLGYPGDFEVMNYVYTWRHQGETVFGRLLHRIGLHAMECVTSRMVMMHSMAWRR